MKKEYKAPEGTKIESWSIENNTITVVYGEDNSGKGEFKRGDILKSKGSDAIFILDAISPKPEDEEWCSSIIGLNFQGILVQRDTYCWGSIHDARLATHEEQQVLFDALKSIGKKWNAETLEIEELDISEIVVDWLSACEYLNKPMPKNYVYEPNSDFEKQINAQIELQMIREAWNKADGFVVDLEDSGQSKYYPIINLFTGNFEVGVGVSCVSATVHSACYSFKSRERAIQFGNQFKELFKTAMGIE